MKNQFKIVFADFRKLKFNLGNMFHNYAYRKYLLQL